MTISGRKAWLLVAGLLLSVAINLAGAGYILGRGVRPGPEQMLQHGIDRFAASLPPEGRDAVRAAFEERHQALTDRIGELRASRQEVVRLLQAPQLDQAALEQALAQVRAQTTEVQTTVQGAIVDAAGRMPAEVRAQWRPRFVGGH